MTAAFFAAPVTPFRVRKKYFETGFAEAIHGSGPQPGRGEQARCDAVTFPNAVVPLSLRAAFRRKRHFRSHLDGGPGYSVSLDRWQAFAGLRLSSVDDTA
jgi:hypothetical protein